MSLWDEYETDREGEQLGKWKEFAGGLRLKIARADADANPDYAKKLQKVLVDSEALTEEKAALKMVELYASLVIEAEGLVDKKGITLKPTIKNLIDVFVKLPELYKQIRIFANDFNNYKLNEAAERLGK